VLRNKATTVAMSSIPE